MLLPQQPTKTQTPTWSATGTLSDLVMRDRECDMFFPTELPNPESEMTTSMSIQRAVLTHQKDMVFHANATFRGASAYNPR
jgi:hypothetical protein